MKAGGRAQKVRDRLTTTGHYLTAFVIFLKGVDKAEQHWHGHEALIVFLFASATYVAVGTLLHHRLHGRAALVLQASFYALEAMISGWIALFLREEGKRYLPILFGLAAAGFAIAFLVHTAMVLRPLPVRSDAAEV